MSVSTAFLDHLNDLFESLGHITARRMFGGATLYCDGLAFALIDGDVLYLRADDATKQRFIDEGLPQFTYAGQTGPVAMKHWRAPERLFDEPDECLEWGRNAVHAVQTANVQAAKASPIKSKRDGTVPRNSATRGNAGGVSGTSMGAKGSGDAAVSAGRGKAKCGAAKRAKI